MGSEVSKSEPDTTSMPFNTFTQAPVTSQPRPQTSKTPDYPRGLESFKGLTELKVFQHQSLWVRVKHQDLFKPYTVAGRAGEELFVVEETTTPNCCSRNCCKLNRAFEMSVVSKKNEDVIHFKHNLECSNSCFMCCPTSIEVYSKECEYLGRTETVRSMKRINLVVKNAADDVMLLIEGPSCCTNLRSKSVRFDVINTQNQAIVGTITRHWPMSAAQAFTENDNFTISFDKRMDLTLKALLLGAWFLIEITYHKRLGLPAKGFRPSTTTMPMRLSSGTRSCINAKYSSSRRSTFAKV